MRVDRQQRPWLIGCSLALLLATACWWQARSNPLDLLTGGSAWGLCFGIAAAACMLIAIALTLRKKLSTWPLGKARHWMAGHVWLGVLTLPLVLFHGDFEFGGTLTRWLMALFFVSWASGVFGLALQHWLPRMMTEQIARETIYEQIDHVVDLLRAEARALVEKHCGPLDAPDGPRTGTAPLRDFYVAQVQPYLAAARPKKSPFDQRSTAPMQRAHLKRLVSAELHDAVDDLFDVCDERRQIEQQRRLHHWLHGWLFVHVPVSWAVVAMTFWHALRALHYT
ncbi:MAG: hypothetical protein EXS13_04155 [Planctomycetes bacterium]|nr:hypothetical protein [Planctomycetota bacterium]